jgi:type I restriction enzyme R subunit
LAQTAFQAQDVKSFDQAVELIKEDIAGLPEKSVAVKEKWQEIHAIKRGETLDFSPVSQSVLQADIAPLMQWRDTRFVMAAYQFDELMAQIQVAFLTKSPQLADYKLHFLNNVSKLPINLNQVRAKLDVINEDLLEIIGYFAPPSCDERAML